MLAIQERLRGLIPGVNSSTERFGGLAFLVPVLSRGGAILGLIYCAWGRRSVGAVFSNRKVAKTMRISWLQLVGGASLRLMLLIFCAGYAAAMGPGERELLASERFRGIEAIEIDSDSFDVSIVGNRTNTTTAEVHGTPSVSATIRRRGDRVIIEAKERRALFSRSRMEGIIEVQAFEGVDIEVACGSGNVDIRGLQGGRLEVRTGSGDIVARAIFGETRLRSGSGDFRMERVGGNLEAGTGSGNIDLQDGEGRISLSSSSGDLELRGVSGDIEASSSSGEVSVIDGEGVFSLASTSGSVVAEQIDLRNSSRFRSVSGDIELDLRGEVSEYSYDLRSVSGSIRVGDNQAGNRFARDGGSLLVEGNTTSGSITVE